MSEQAQSAVGTELGNKLSVKSFGWDKTSIQRAVLTGDGSDVFLMRVIGTATGVKEYTARGKGDNGDDLEGYGIRGTFEAQGSDGEVIPAALVYFPGYITDQMADALMSGDDVTLKVAIDIYARPNEQSATGYVYVGRSLIAQENKALDALRNQVKNLPLPSSPGAPALTGPGSKRGRA
jgi:hypothetical protein